jgi:hypothetical protein
MGTDKQMEPLRVEVDELALSLVGWQVDEVQARLVTKTYGKKDHRQEVSVSGTLRFLSEDWTDRFSGSSYVPSPLLALVRRGGSAAPGLQAAVFETEKKASKRPLRFSHSSRRWECKQPLKPEDLELKLTAYDINEVDSNFELTPEEVIDIPSEVIDDTTRSSVKARVVNATVQILVEDYSDNLRVHLEGVFEYGTAQQLLTDHVEGDDWRDSAPTLEKECPFEVDVPQVEVEILDEVGFLLENGSFSIYAHIPVQEGGKLPGRQPRWVAQGNWDVDDMAGTPARVIVRIVDGEE